jgi:hypothetical protein
MKTRRCYNFTNINGVPVPQALEAKYLGLMFDQQASAATMMLRRVQVYTSQFYAVLSDMRRAADRIPNTVPITIKMLRVRAESAGLWVVGCLPSAQSAQWPA